MRDDGRDVLITGVGLVSSLGRDTGEHVAHLRNGAADHTVDEERFAPYCVHPLAPLDFAQQIPKKSDLKQMEAWQRIGVYAAGLALSDAGLAGNAELLPRTHLVVAAGSGERDISVDCDVLDKLSQTDDSTALAKQVLPSALRPTLFLAQLSNMLAGNISIVHGVTASSRTFMGEEIAGLAAIENAFRRIAAGQIDIAIVGGALNAEREDLLLGYELGHNLWKGSYASVWDRAGGGGGFIPGGVGAFLVLETRAHAEARDVQPYARITDVATGRCDRASGATQHALEELYARMPGKPTGPLTILSGASGAAPVTDEEIAFIDSLPAYGAEPIVRAFGSTFGHSVEAQFPTGLALAALACRHKLTPKETGNAEIERPFSGSTAHALVTCVGHWRGEGLALVGAA
ncbi:MAG TPA: beta-ketoacyl-ACP synthase [Hyphomicrobium sp.]|nr:beta-ketoacyl-ACP synthase [Hyphomicrobium sp.]